MDDYECCPTNILPDHNGRGVTYWGPITATIQAITGTVPGTVSFAFTPTQPACYQLEDNCVVYFNSNLNNANSNTDATIKLKINTFDPSIICLPRIDGYVGNQAFDLVNAKDNQGNPQYLGTITNSITFENHSTVEVTLTSLRIFRVYQMCNLDWDKMGCCEGTASCVSTFPAPIGTVACSHGQSVASVGLDSTRVDYPCNFETCGGRSYSFYKDPTFNNTIIPAGGTVQWTFDFSSFSTHNYLQGDVCLFNFNKIYPTSTDTNNNYIKLDTSINGNTLPWGFYLSNQGPSGGTQHPLYPSRDLAGFLPYYHDSGTNTITLINSGSVPVKMEDNYGVNIYRIYQTSQVHPYTISTYTTEGGTITPWGNIELDKHDNQAFTIQANSGYTISQIRVDSNTIYPCPPDCNEYEKIIYDVQEDYIIDAVFGECGVCETCETCYTTCNTGCEVTCETGCEVSCETGCEVSCETGCEISCTTCQTQCQNCQTTCQVSCQTGCEISCQSCNTCQTGCEVSCQTGCEVACQTGCEVGCQTGCEISCQTGCEVCETMCETSTCHSITVTAYDQYGPVSTAVYIDSNYAGTSGTAIQVTEGQHTIGVDDPVGDSHFYVFPDYGELTENPVTINVTTDLEIGASYWNY
jgi:hypothetical protein